MFFKLSRTLVKAVRSETRMNGPVKVALFQVYCLIAIASIIFLGFVFSLGLPESLAWVLFGAGVAPVLFFYCLWEANIPAGANYLWPKVWHIRGRQIWPRQK